MRSLAIEREFGSGGREIGMLVAQKSQIPYYDGELLLKAAEKQGVSVGLLRAFDEQRLGSLMYDIAAFSSYANNQKNTVYELFSSMQQTIRNLELQGPAVFIGRCSTEILKDRPRVLRVFVYSSDMDKRITRIAKENGLNALEAKNLLQKKDRDRRNYFRFWTQKDWLDRGNYDMELNTAMMGIHILWYRIPEKISDATILLCSCMMCISFVLYVLKNCRLLKESSNAAKQESSKWKHEGKDK